MKYFVINSGSSSIKYQVIEMTTEAVLATGLVERIGEAAGRLKNTTFPGSSHALETVIEQPIPDHYSGMMLVIAALLTWRLRGGR